MHPGPQGGERLQRGRLQSDEASEIAEIGDVEIPSAGRLVRNEHRLVDAELCERGRRARRRRDQRGKDLAGVQRLRLQRHLGQPRRHLGREDGADHVVVAEPELLDEARDRGVDALDVLIAVDPDRQVREPERHGADDLLALPREIGDEGRAERPQLVVGRALAKNDAGVLSVLPHPLQAAAGVLEVSPRRIGGAELEGEGDVEGSLLRAAGRLEVVVEEHVLLACAERARRPVVICDRQAGPKRGKQRQQLRMPAHPEVFERHL